MGESREGKESPLGGSHSDNEPDNLNSELSTYPPDPNKAKVSVTMHSTMSLVCFGGQRSHSFVPHISDPGWFQNMHSYFYSPASFLFKYLAKLFSLPTYFLRNYLGGKKTEVHSNLFISLYKKKNNFKSSTGLDTTMGKSHYLFLTKVKT